MNSRNIEETAARWFWKRDSEDWTTADQTRFETWLQSSTAHRVAYLRLSAGWKRAARMKALGAGVPAAVVPPKGAWGDARFSSGAILQTPATTPSPAKKHLWAAAASLALMLAAAVYVFETGLWNGNRYTTAIGATETVTLADGSQITLNTDTRIRVAMSDKERRIVLDKGEAFFNVAKEAARPFVVQAGDKRVTAIGTSFSVRREIDDVRIIVTEGRVKLEQKSITAMQTPARPEVAPPPAVALDAGAVARTSRTQVLVQSGSAAEVEQLLSWRNGYLVFEATPLADAVAEFNRYNERRIFILDPAIAAVRIGGNFRTDNIDAFLWLLQSGFPIAVEQRADRVILTAR